MDDNKPGFNSIDEYIDAFPVEVRSKLDELRAIIKAAAPEAQEKISYQMPTFTLNGNLIHFAAYKKHIGFYPVPRSVEEFKDELMMYKGTKSSMHLPLDRPLPAELISRIVKFRVADRLKNTGSKLGR